MKIKMKEKEAALLLREIKGGLEERKKQEFIKYLKLEYTKNNGEADTNISFGGGRCSINGLSLKIAELICSAAVSIDKAYKEESDGAKSIAQQIIMMALFLIEIGALDGIKTRKAIVELER